MREEKVLIPSTGIQLEGLMNIGEALSFKGGVVFCHPHHSQQPSTHPTPPGVL
jgi:hypothetical protein